MAYKRIDLMDVYEIIRRWHNGQSNSHIARTLNYDRKTVGRYINDAIDKGISKEKPLPDKEKVRSLLKEIIKDKPNHQPARRLLDPYKEEIIELVTAEKNALKPKIVFEVICKRYNLNNRISYSSFKRFYRQRCQSEVLRRQGKTSPANTCRIETLPGQQVQIDYAKMGLLYDRQQKRKRTVYAFIATLSFSRHKFIDFVWKQDQQSFVASHIKMLNHFNGIPETIVLDNLKSGVIKPDLYDPKMNRLYAEMAEHYGLFLDPCRVGKPQDKGKVERDVQTVRQQFYKMIALHPDLELHQANQTISQWVKNEYGQRPHGTTGLRPFVCFNEHEKPKLKALPFKPFELAEWKPAKVHPDCFVQYRKTFYSVPHQYAGQKVWIRAADKIVSIYFQEALIKQHIITDSRRHTDFKDFPENVRMALDDNLPQILIRKAAKVGPSFKRMVRNILEIHAFLNLRKAQGLVSLRDKFPPSQLEKAARYIIDKDIQTNPKQFKHLLKFFPENENKNCDMAISDTTQSFIREADYFDHHTNEAK